MNVPELNIQPPTQESISRGSDGMDVESNSLVASEAYQRTFSSKRSCSNSAESDVSHTSKISRRSPSPDLQGASRIEGGFSRGKAQGNVLNFADMCMIFLLHFVIYCVLILFNLR